MDKRIDRLEKRLGAPERAQVSFCDQSRWPPSAWEEFMTARNLHDQERLADLAEQFSGVRPHFDGVHIGIVITYSGPPSDEAAAVMEAERILGEGSER